MGSDAYCPGDSKAIQRGTPTSRLLPHAQQSRQNSGRSRIISSSHDRDPLVHKCRRGGATEAPQGEEERR